MLLLFPFEIIITSKLTGQNHHWVESSTVVKSNLICQNNLVNQGNRLYNWVFGGRVMMYER